MLSEITSASVHALLPVQWENWAKNLLKYTYTTDPTYYKAI